MLSRNARLAITAFLLFFSFSLFTLVELLYLAVDHKASDEA